MAIIYSYPQAIPKDSDLIIGTVTYDPNDPSPVRGNPTRSFRVSDLAASITGNSYTLTSKALGANSSIVLTDNTGFIAGTVNFNSGAGMSVLDAGNTITITNTGVLSNIEGAGISLSGTTGNVTITNSGVTGMLVTDTTYIDLSLSSATGDVTLTAALSATGLASNTTYLRGDNVWFTPVTTINTTDGTYINLTPNTAANGAVTVTADLSATGLPNNQTFLRGDNQWATPGGGGTVIGTGTAGKITKWKALSEIQDSSVMSELPAAGEFTGPYIEFSGTGGASMQNLEVNGWLLDGISSKGSLGQLLSSTGTTVEWVNAVTSLVAGTNIVLDPISGFGDVTVSAPDVIPYAETSTATMDFVSEDAALGGGSPSDTVLSSQLAIKTYVDNSVVGGLVYQGGYDASTNNPVLDSRGTQIAVTKGWTYTVTADGTFYGEVVKVGDVLIAETNLAAGTGALTDWTTVQSNIDLATAGTSGTVIKGLAGFNEDNFTVSNGFVSAKSTTSNSTITGTATVTHTLDTRDVIVQLYDTVTFETIYADVVRTSITEVTVNFGVVPTNPVRVLIMKAN